MSNAFSIQNGLKQEDALLPLLYNLSVQYASQKSQANHKGLQLNEAYHFYADHVTLLDENIHTTKRQTKAF